MVLSTLQTYRTGNLSKDEEGNGGKSRAVRARQRAIGRELRRMYDGVVSEPVPDEFMDLLRRMDDVDADKKKTS
jgi:Anti-sigma factor NepR